MTGPTNIIAGTFPQWHHKYNDVTQNVEGNNVVQLGWPLRAVLHYKMKDTYYSLLNNLELVECFLTLPNEECYLNLPNTIALESPLNFETIKEKQLEDEELKNWADKYLEQYITKRKCTLPNMLAYVKPGHNPEI